MGRGTVGAVAGRVPMTTTPPGPAATATMFAKDGHAARQLEPPTAVQWAPSSDHQRSVRPASSPLPRARRPCPTETTRAGRSGGLGARWVTVQSRPFAAVKNAAGWATVKAPSVVTLDWSTLPTPTYPFR